jgi:membrane protease YdiL (CAAX protease family)
LNTLQKGNFMPLYPPERSLNTLSPSKEKSHRIIAWSLLGGLLFLRIPFYAGISFFASPKWLNPAFQVGTFLLTACLVWWERERLADFYIDALALGILIVFKPVLTILSIEKLYDSPLAFPNLPALALWIIAIGLLLALWLSRAHLPKPSLASLGWFGVGIGVGFLVAVLMAYPFSFTIDLGQISGAPDIKALLGQAPSDFVFQLGYAAGIEEPVFRAFLWGYLHKAGWKMPWILLFQAFLFTLAHIYYLRAYPILFWLVIPFGSLVLGALAWRARSISASLAAHASMNTFGYTLGWLVALCRL